MNHSPELQKLKIKVFSTISSNNHNAKYKELKSSVCHQFVTRIALLKKLMIPMTLKYQNWVEPLSGNNRKGKIVDFDISITSLKMPFHLSLLALLSFTPINEMNADYKVVQLDQNGMNLWQQN